MKILSVKVNSYGKFKDTDIEFKDGVNIIYGKNEAGKSTLMSFIKGMLYGFKGKGTGLANERKRYTPWDGTPISGEIRLKTQSGELLSVSRSCGKTAASDKITVINLESGEKAEFSAQDEIGLSEEAFSKILYVKQLGSKMSGENDEITTRLINLSSGGDEENGYHTAVGLVEDAIREYKHKKGDGGLVNELKREIMLLRSEYEKEKAFEAENVDDVRRCHEIEEEIAKTEEEILRADKKIKLIKKYLDFDKVRKEQVKQEKISERIVSAKEKLSAVQADIAGDSALESEPSPIIYEVTEKDVRLEERLQEITEKSGKYKTPGVLLLCISAVSFVGGFFFLPLFLLTLISLCGYVFFIANSKKLEAEALSIKTMADEMAQKELERKKELEKYGCKTLKEYTDKKTAYGVLLEKKKQLENEIKQLEEEKNSIIAPAQILSQEVLNEFADISYTEADLENERYIRDEKFKTKVKLQGELAEKNSKIESGNATHRSSVEIAEEIYLLEEKLRECEEKLNILTTVKETLDEAYAKISKTFAPKLNGEASKILERITDGRHTEFVLDKQYNVLMGQGGFKELDYFSLGTVDQVYLAVRMALCKMIANEKQPPMFFDDTFVQFDSEREKMALEVINEFSKENQVFIFTCKDELLKMADCHIIKL